MKTITLQEIDGYTVITKINPAGGFIDPEETKKVVAVEIQKSETYQQIEAIKLQMRDIAIAAKVAYKSANQALFKARQVNPKAKSSAVADAQWSEYRAQMVKFRELQDALLPLAIALKSEISELTLAHAVYFNLQPGEEYRSDAEAESIAEAMAAASEKNAVLAIADKKLVEVADYRGRKYWKKKAGVWSGAEITALAVEPPAGAIEETALTEAQRAEISTQLEAERISKMKASDREVEKAAALDGIAAQANEMRGKLEITGDAEALAKSQAWYQEQAAKVMEKYGGA